MSDSHECPHCRRLRVEAEELRQRLLELEERAAETATPDAGGGDRASSRRFSSRDRAQLAVESAGLAWWDHDLIADRVERSGNWAGMLGYEPEQIADDGNAWRNLLHPDDRPLVEETARRHERGELSFFEVEHRMLARDGTWRWILNWGKVVERDAEGRPLRALGTHLDITRRKQAELDREELVAQLEKALAEIKTLRGIIPICSSCKKIRDDQGYWNQLESYLSDHSDMEFSHAICPDCLDELYPEFGKRSREK